MSQASQQDLPAQRAWVLARTKDLDSGLSDAANEGNAETLANSGDSIASLTSVALAAVSDSVRKQQRKRRRNHKWAKEKAREINSGGEGDDDDNDDYNDKQKRSPKLKDQGTGSKSASADANSDPLVVGADARLGGLGRSSNSPKGRQRYSNWANDVAKQINESSDDEEIVKLRKGKRPKQQRRSKSCGSEGEAADSLAMSNTKISQQRKKQQAWAKERAQEINVAGSDDEFRGSPSKDDHARGSVSPASSAHPSFSDPFGHFSPLPFSPDFGNDDCYNFGSESDKSQPIPSPVSRRSSSNKSSTNLISQIVASPNSSSPILVSPVVQNTRSNNNDSSRTQSPEFPGFSPAPLSPHYSDNHSDSWAKDQHSNADDDSAQENADKSTQEDAGVISPNTQPRRRTNGDGACGSADQPNPQKKRRTLGSTNQNIKGLAKPVASKRPLLGASDEDVVSGAGKEKAGTQKDSPLDDTQPTSSEQQALADLNALSADALRDKLKKFGLKTKEMSKGKMVKTMLNIEARLKSAARKTNSASDALSQRTSSAQGSAPPRVGKAKGGAPRRRHATTDSLTAAAAERSSPSAVSRPSADYENDSTDPEVLTDESDLADSQGDDYGLDNPDAELSSTELSTPESLHSQIIGFIKASYMSVERTSLAHGNVSALHVLLLLQQRPWIIYARYPHGTLRAH